MAGRIVITFGGSLVRRRIKVLDDEVAGDSCYRDVEATGKKSQFVGEATMNRSQWS